MAFAFLPPVAFFEAPLAAAAVAGGAVSIPVIIHLLNRKRFRVVTWAAMRFLLAAQRKNSRRMRLEQLLLLAVRCLIVLLLVGAMAAVTPWAEAGWRRLFPDAVVAVTSSSQRTHKILVLDGSFSMGLRVGDQTCFERARGLAAHLVRGSTGGDGYSVVLMSAPARRIVPEPSEDVRRVADEIEAVRLPHGNADLAGTLNTVESLLQASPGKFPEKEVYFFTDMQRSTWVARQPGVLGALLQRIQSRAQTVFVDVGRDGVSNLAVTDLALGDDLATTDRTTTVLAALHNYGETRDAVPVKLLVGRAREKTTDPPCEPRVVQEAVVRAERGQQTPVAFAYKFPAAGDYLLQVQVENDALALDDVRSAVVTVKKDVPVLLVNGKTEGEPFDQATEWLRLALNPFEGEQVPGNVSARPRVLNATQFADEAQGDLTPYDAAFLCDMPSFSVAERKRMEAYVRRGGGLVLCLGNKVQAGEYNRELYRKGAGLLPAPLDRKQVAGDAFNFQFSLDPDADREPPLKAFRAESDRLSLLSPRFRCFYTLGDPVTPLKPRKVLSFAPVAIPGRTPAEGAKTPPPGGPALLEWHPYLVGEDARPAERDDGRGTEPARRVPARGRVVLLTTTANSDWSNWPASPSYPALMQELLHFAAAGRLREQSVPVGEALELFLQSSGAGLEASVQTPDGRTETARTQVLEEASVLRWLDTDTSGVYKVVIGQHPREYLFAVNVPVATEGQEDSESNLVRTGREELQKVYPEWEIQVVQDPRQAVHASPVSGVTETVLNPLGTAVARWLLLVLFALLLTEVVLAWHFGHFSSTAGRVAAENVTRGPAVVWLLRVLVVLPWCLFLATLALGLVLLHDAWTGDFLGFLPETARRGIERLLNVPAPSEGEGSHWRLEFNAFLWDGQADPWLAAALFLGGTALVGLIYRREARAMARSAGAGQGLLASLARAPFSLAVAVGLRLCLLLLMLAVLLPQLRLWFERQGWPDVAIVIDDSLSMKTTDRYRDPRVREAAERLARDGNLAEPERLRLAQALLTRGDTDWLTALLTRRKVRVHVYHCSTRAARIADLHSPGEVGPALEAIRGLQAERTNDTSQLGVAVRQVLNDFRGSSLAAVVMLTDGVTTEGEDLPQVSKYAAQVGVPLFFVGLGDAHEARDLYLHDLQVEDSVYVNDRLVFELRLTAQGYDAMTVPVQLREKGKDQVLKAESVRTDPTGKPTKVRIIYQPTEPGDKEYELETPVLPDEVDPDNNKVRRRVQVREAKLIKVLYVEGYRRYEYQYLKTLLERESDRTKGNKSIDLKVLLQDADPDFATQDRTALADFPTRAELAAYDVILLGDVDPRPRDNNKMTEHLQDVADFVREKGGGLLMIAGERFAPQAFKDSPLRDVLPIDVTAEQALDDPEGTRAEGYRPELTPVGRLHPIFRFSPDEKENEEVWNRLREMYWWAEGFQPKRAAEVLAVHPQAPAAAGERAADAGEPGGAAAPRAPLVVQQFVGGGRSMFFGFCETWRWGFREDQLRFNQFWIQTIRYLARSRLGRIDLRLDRQTPYRRGEPVRGTVRVPDDAPPPAPDTEVKVVVERRVKGERGEASVRTVQLARLEGSRATYEAVLTTTPEGEYKFWLSQPAVANPRPGAECRVLAPPGELEQLRMNQPDLEKAAEQSHGRFYNLADADRLLEEMPAGSRVTLNTPAPPLLLWNQTLLFLLVLLLLVSEWVLRKQRSLL